MSNRIEDNMNYIDDVKGRKYSLGNFKFIGEFTLIDLMICIFAFLLSFSLYFINIAFGVIMTFIIFAFVFGFVSEYKTLKAYERIINKIKFKAGYKKIATNPLFDINDNNDIYEVVYGFDINNMSKKDFDLINNSLNNLFDSALGRIKIWKFNSTLRIDDLKQNYQDLIDLDWREDYLINKQLIISSYKNNIEKFSERSMPNFYIKFLDISELDRKNLINKFKSIIELRKISNEEFKIIQASIFDFEEELKISSKFIENSENKYTLGKINFGRKVPSYWLQRLIVDPNVFFSVEFKKPSFKEKEYIKKSIKRWAKTIQNESIEEYTGKDFFETKKKTQQRQAKNEIMLNNIIGKDEIKLMNIYVLIKMDKNNPLSFKKQISDIDFENDKLLNINIDLIDGKQMDLLKEFFMDESNEKSWYPTNASTISNAVIFQNQSFIDKDGAYIGTINNIFPFIYNVWKDGNSGKHTGILAKTGAGKSILMKKLIIADEVMADAKQYILDPKDDGYDKVIGDRFNWEKINVFDLPLNPLLININVNDIGKEIDSKIIDIQEWLYILFEKEVETNQVNDMSLFVEYLKRFLIYWYKESSFANRQPTFSIFKKWLKTQEDREEYKIIFSKLIEGSYSRFDVENNKQLSDKSIVFNLLEVFNITNEAMRNSILFLIFNLIIESIFNRNDKQRKLSLWIDEAGDFFKSKFLTKKFELLMVKSRSFNTKIGWATQNPTDLIDSGDKALFSIFSNTEHLFIGQLKDSQIGSINDMLQNAESDNLTEVEKEWINDSTNEEDKGKFLYFNSQQRYRIQADYLNDIYFKTWNEEFKREENRG